MITSRCAQSPWQRIWGLCSISSERILFQVKFKKPWCHQMHFYELNRIKTPLIKWKLVSTTVKVRRSGLLQGIAVINARVFDSGSGLENGWEERLVRVDLGWVDGVSNTVSTSTETGMDLNWRPVWPTEFYDSQGHKPTLSWENGVGFGSWKTISFTKWVSRWQFSQTWNHLSGI